ncbi:MAG: hypothetical protein JST86_11505 [Bacteroidetes bacterium]|nr:hypothetical protein [Bacteroidota bacterium]
MQKQKPKTKSSIFGGTRGGGIPTKKAVAKKSAPKKKSIPRKKSLRNK